MTLNEKLYNAGIVPVVVIKNLKNAIPTAKALLAGGVAVIEITLRTEAGLDAIKEVADNCPEMLVGAGTVLTLEQCKNAVEKGAKFIVSPGFDKSMVEWCIENKITILPGCVTPTEIMQALSLGIDIVKFFPANVYGGLSAMKSLAAPFGTVRFVPTGGVDAENIVDYLKAPFIFATGGSWLCTAADIDNGEFSKITDLSKEVMKKVDSVRGEKS